MLAAMDAVRVLPSPVAISATYPLIMARAPMIWTGKGRSPTARHAPSRATAIALSWTAPVRRLTRARSRASATASWNWVEPRVWMSFSSTSTRSAWARYRLRAGAWFLNHPATPLAAASSPRSSGALTRRASKTDHSSLEAIWVMGREVRGRRSEVRKVSNASTAFPNLCTLTSDLSLHPLRPALALLDELPEPAAPLLDERLLVELEADVGLLAGDEAGVVVRQLHPQLELRRRQLLAAGVVRIDGDLFPAGLRQRRVGRIVMRRPAVLDGGAIEDGHQRAGRADLRLGVPGVEDLLAVALLDERDDFELPRVRHHRRLGAAGQVAVHHLVQIGRDELPVERGDHRQVRLLLQCLGQLVAGQLELVHEHVALQGVVAGGLADLDLELGHVRLVALDLRVELLVLGDPEDLALLHGVAVLQRPAVGVPAEFHDEPGGAAAHDLLVDRL